MRAKDYFCIMNFIVILHLDTRTPKKDGTCPLIFRIYKNRSSYFAFSTGYSLLPKDWDSTKRVVKNSYKGSDSVTWLNNYLQRKKVEFTDILGKLRENNTLNNLTNLEIKERLLGGSSDVNFYSYTDKIINEFKVLKRIGNARSYSYMLNSIKNFNNNKIIKFSDITYDFLKKYEFYYLSKEGNSKNGLAVYMRTLRAIYNRAIKDGHVQQEKYPFLTYKIKTEPTQKRSISYDHIKSIEDLTFSEGTALYNCKNYFLLSFYLMGLSYTDLAHLTKKNIQNGRITFSRQKTHRIYEMAITEKAIKIIDYYLNKYPDIEYILPIITKIEPNEIYKQVSESRKRFNKQLKKIAELCGIDKNLTSYVSRHSFATLAKNKGIPITAISEMLGHENIKTTQVYLDSLPSDVIDQYHRDILGD